MDRMMMQRAKASACAALVAVVVTSLFPLPAAAEGADSPALIDTIEVTNSTTDAWGGGDQLLIRVGNNLFGVVYGDGGDRQSYVTFFAAVVRALGTADVYEAASGRLVKENVTLPVVTVVAQRMLGIVEFRDVGPEGVGPGDGIFNYRPNLASPELLDFASSEPLVKSLSLEGTWNLSGFGMAADGHDAVNIDYTLTLSHTKYTNSGPAEWAGDGVVDAVAFHVHTTIRRTTQTLVEVPHYDATVMRTRDGRELTAVTADGTTTQTAAVTQARFKIDHEIVGWDRAPVVHDSPTRLLLVTAVPVGTAVNRTLAPWVSEIAFADDRAERAEANVEGGDTVVVDGGNRTPDTFTPSTQLSIRDRWRETAHLAFDPFVQVWGGPDQVEPEKARAFLQVLGGARFAERTDATLYRGFVVIAGFSYPAGYRVYHDPEVVAEGVELGADSLLPSILPGVVMAGQLAFIGLAVAGSAALAIRFSSARARARRAREAERLEALKEQFQLPPGGGSP